MRPVFQGLFPGVILGPSYYISHMTYSKVIDGNLTKDPVLSCRGQGEEPAGHGEAPLLLTVFASQYHPQTVSSSCGRGTACWELWP